jgi:hypothetical protein
MSTNQNLLKEQNNRTLDELKELRKNKQKEMADLSIRINQYQDMLDALSQEEWKYEEFYAPFIFLKEAYLYLIADCRRRLHELQYNDYKPRR